MENWKDNNGLLRDQEDGEITKGPAIWTYVKQFSRLLLRTVRHSPEVRWLYHVRRVLFSVVLQPMIS